VRLERTIAAESGVVVRSAERMKQKKARSIFFCE